VTVTAQRALEIGAAANLDLMRFVDGGLRLQGFLTSALHHLVEAHPDGAFVSQFMDGSICRVGFPTYEPKIWGAEQVLLLQHDWSAALQVAREEAVDFRPPFGNQVFELKVSDKRVCVRVMVEDTGKVFCVCFVWLASAWVMLPLYDLNTGIIPDSPPSPRDLEWSGKYLYPIYDLVVAQVRGACIALDSKIAAKQIVPASAQVNKSRVASRKTPLFDFHILTLRGRTERDRSDLTEPSVARVRLHFRRGHYRHFSETSKTWINWTLVGDPDLGFIDKHYRLRQ